MLCMSAERLDLLVLSICLRGRAGMQRRAPSVECELGGAPRRSSVDEHGRRASSSDYGSGAPAQWMEKGAFDIVDPHVSESEREEER